ncbi:hypothetical protein PTSG_12350 [Salpingoeca rosetta]|uniref:Ppx/GppA phosphatase N-terminal domain-containing protein n=1 Tax=Salpingoeca rosetta (strain ATCC 50818 / BSB-021) TaxID=946362 RepID=F2UAY9_SALR5|nr:uncharacterized protein PTSG_12350 [Salpingoeca rosetta]EGD74002.1 hypothetical protein PTSG_12350 [Salpingoeca rosetta]|eukprot:XP_004993565.1 hypothetical protein PTSG_12350 [Salpingoeca rosetta]
MAQRRIVAALDIGSGRTKMDVVVLKGGAVVETLFSEHREVFFAHDYAMNGHKNLSDKITTHGMTVLKDFKKTATELGAQRISGAATQVFRKAENGPAFLDRVKRELGMDVRVISQAVEGKVGFLSAKSAMPASTPLDHVIAYDSGAASFQITVAKPDATGPIPNVEVFEGQWGTIPALEALMCSVRGQERLTADTSDPHPVTRDEMTRVVDHISASLPPPSPLLAGRFDAARQQTPGATIMSFGEESSIFAIAAKTLEQNAFSQADMDRALDLVANLPTSTFQERGYAEPQLVVPKLCLLRAVMKHFDMPKVVYSYINGSCPGIAVFDDAQGSSEGDSS